MIVKAIKPILLMLNSLKAHLWNKAAALSQYLVFHEWEEGKDFGYNVPFGKHGYTQH